MKKLASLLFALVVSVCSLSATNIPGGNVSGLWTLAGSPYIILGSIMVPNGSTLTIEPGTEVRFQGTCKLLVLGSLQAIGTVTDTIIFTATNITAGWRGIRFDNTSSTNDSSKISYCKLQYAKAAASSSGYDADGGALFFDNFSKAIVSNCRINNNTASMGGGIFCINNSNPLIINNIIANNTGLSGGGGIYYGFSNPIISNNVISNNSGYFGGGIYFYADNIGATIISNIISNNIAPNGTKGGGIYCSGNNTIINNNLILNNEGGGGGGIYITNCNPTIINNTISNNSASNFADGGGGINSDGGSLPIISNNAIINNTASFGGGILLLGSSPNITNNTIANNSATNGGAFYCTMSSPTIMNSIIWGNTAIISGQQVYLIDEDSDPDFYNCNLQGGEAAFELNNNFYIGTYQNNINSDPVFVSPSVGSGIGYHGQTANWSLLCSSPCINSGNSSGTYPTIDLAGNPRVINGIIDIGAYEYNPATIPIANAGPDDTVCGNTYSLLAIPSVCTGTWTVVSSPGSVTFADPNLPTSNIVVGISGLYTLAWTENNGGFFDADTVMVQFNQTPTSTFVASNIQCYGDNSTITYTGNANIISDYHWDFNGATILYGYGAGPYSVTWAYAGTNTISLSVSQDGCQSNITTINVENPPPLYVSMISTNESSSGANDGSININATGGTWSYLYQWNNSATTEDLTGLGAGTYSVTITDSNGCTYAAATDIVIGINEISNINSFNIYPNPAQTVVNINFSTPLTGEIKITDITGKVTKTFTINASHMMALDVSDLPTGEYILTAVEKQSKLQYKKICILR
ncbi:MAG: right-handed parallel beta-helix repeat-containing protein [Bacteroidia bacterium]|nr:right-handed parallel beta-helix repeat-containing protein [Bacteroidia bacterium]